MLKVEYHVDYFRLGLGLEFGIDSEVQNAERVLRLLGLVGRGCCIGT